MRKKPRILMKLEAKRKMKSITSNYMFWATLEFTDLISTMADGNAP